jgi:replicative DNA helicase
MHACLFGLNYRALAKNEADMNEWHKTLKGMSDIEGECIIYDLPVNSNPSQFIGIIKKEKPDVVVVDYIGLMKSSTRTNEDWLNQLEIANELRGLAKRQKVAVITASQLNRDGVRRGQTASFTDTSRSFQITHPCSFVFRIWTDGGNVFNIYTEKTNDAPKTSIELSINWEIMRIFDNGGKPGHVSYAQKEDELWNQSL